MAEKERSEPEKLTGESGEANDSTPDKVIVKPVLYGDFWGGFWAAFQAT